MSGTLSEVAAVEGGAKMTKAQKNAKVLLEKFGSKRAALLEARWRARNGGSEEIEVVRALASWNGGPFEPQIPQKRKRTIEVQS